VKTRSEDAFYEIYSCYFDYLMLIGVKKGFETAQIEDTINDIFLYLWEHSERLSAIKHHHNYILTIFLRKLYRKPRIQFDETLSLEDVAHLASLPSVEEVFIASQEMHLTDQKIRMAVDKLPEKQRKLLYQKFFLGLSYAEIAQANNVSVNTVYNTIYKAMANIRGSHADRKSFISRVFLSLFFAF